MTPAQVFDMVNNKVTSVSDSGFFGSLASASNSDFKDFERLTNPFQELEQFPTITVGASLGTGNAGGGETPKQNNPPQNNNVAGGSLTVVGQGQLINGIQVRKPYKLKPNILQETFDNERLQEKQVLYET